MRGPLRYLLLLGVAFLLPSFAFPLRAQDRCGTVQHFKSTNPDHRLRTIRFEQWLTERKRLREDNGGARRSAAAYRIPVVVHVIHNGEEIGTGANISEAQILSQIRVLNEDFNRQNADAVNTPAVFASVAGSLDIEFVLALQDPDGQATNGIVRVDGNRPSWSMTDNYELKSLSYWPAEEYMNIWVVNLTNGHAGYAQFPQSDLAGMENSSTNRLTDGIVIWHRAFGSEDDGNFDLDRVFNKGRTATHETGHFLGLNHIWGDESDCDGTDYVADTPNQGPSTNGCPTHPRSDGCSSVVMFQNFLDYTNDECMNLFTQGQVDRMIIVLENSPRRASLTTSPGLQEPSPLPNDIGIRTIIFPDASVCSNLVTPVLELRNYGSNSVTSTRIQFIADGAVRQTQDFSLSLAPQESVQVSLDAVTLSSGVHDISFEVLSTNGTTDSGGYNDLKTSTVIIPFFGSAPFGEDFSAQPQGWITRNPDGQITWEIVTVPGDPSPNKALKMNFYNYEDKIGELDVFLSPVLDLSDAPAATLTFDVAYARYQNSNDRLEVIALTNCEDLLQGTVLYNKAGDALKTAPATSQPFTPAAAGEWRKEVVDLSALVGMSRVQIAFVGINDWGNNVYLDNITLFTDPRRDIALLDLDKPAEVSCAQEIAPEVKVRNTGSVVINSLVVDYRVNDGALQTLTVEDITINVGAEQIITLPQISLMERTNNIFLEIHSPNGDVDDDPQNNTGTFLVAINNERDRIPLRQNFDADFTPAWTVINPESGMDWQVVETNFGRSIYFNSFANTQSGDRAWLASPVLDFSRTAHASMVFDLSFGSRDGATDLLTILASTDCGVTYEELSYNIPQPTASADNWLPEDADDWRSDVSVNLNSLVGHEEVRIAFVVTNEGGNNLYLDNIEFFVTSDPPAIELDELYSVYGYDLTNPESSELQITFNLPERQNVRYSVINLAGQLKTDGYITDVLNQTFPVGLSERLAPGIYFIRVQIGGRYYSTKILIP